MRVSSPFQISQYLSKLPDDFKVIKVDLESLKDNTLRRLVRDIENQLGLENAVVNDRISHEERLKQILNDDLFETNDLSSTLIVLGSRGGV